MTKVVTVALGAGGLGDSVFWMWAGFRAPSLAVPTRPCGGKPHQEWGVVESSPDRGMLTSLAGVVDVLTTGGRQGVPTSAKLRVK